MAIEGAGSQQPKEVAAQGQADRATVARKLGQAAGAVTSAGEEAASQVKDKVANSGLAKGVKRGLSDAVKFFKPGVDKAREVAHEAGHAVAESLVGRAAKGAAAGVEKTAKDLAKGYKDGHEK